MAPAPEAAPTSGDAAPADRATAAAGENEAEAGPADRGEAATNENDDHVQP
jgi:hypothetical protein